MEYHNYIQIINYRNCLANILILAKMYINILCVNNAVCRKNTGVIDF